MQIHDITKRPKRTDEGILDSIKNAISATATGFQTASDAFSTNQRVSDQTARNANAAAIARKMAARGYNVNTADPTVRDASGQVRVAGGTIPSVMADNELKQAVVAATKEFKATPEFATEIIGDIPPENNNATIDTETPYVEPGYKLTVPSVVSGYPTDYYIGTDGSWRNGFNQKLTDQATITKLNGLANQGQDTGRIKPTKLPLDQQTKQGKTKQNKSNQNQTKAKTESIEPVAEASAARRARRLAAGITKTPNNRSPSPAVASPDTEKNINAVLTNMVRNDKVSRIFNQLGQKFETTPADVKNRPDVQQAWDTLVRVSSARVKQGKEERVTKAFQNYATTVLSAMKAVGTGEESSPTDTDSTDTSNTYSSTTVSPAQQAQATRQLADLGVDAQTINKVKTAIQRRPSAKPVVKQAIGLDEQLKQQLHRLRYSTLYEDQVQITQDITVKTNLGNYVKRAKDQTWYDPNGIPIDPVKYADYIKKLDATPAAQTRYQADSISGRGSDTAYIKAKTPTQLDPAVHKEAVPDFSQQEALARLKQMQDYNQIQATLRSNNVEGLNSLVMDTFNQLQNAKIFNTGQEPYLRDRMGALMAMKAG